MSHKAGLFDKLVQRTASDGTWYCGIDFANDIDRIGICLVEDNPAQKTLTLHSIAERPPVTNGTKQLLQRLLSSKGLLQRDNHARLRLPSGLLVKQASVEDLLAALQEPWLCAALKNTRDISIRTCILDLAAKMGYPASSLALDCSELWRFLFEAAPRFGQPCQKDHDEAKRVAYIAWLADRVLGEGKKIRLTAVDSPLGICRDYAEILQGKLMAKPSDPKLKERATERFWRERLKEFSKQFPDTVGYFNSASHLKSSGGLEIVPECIYCVLHSVGPEGLGKARRATHDAMVIEAAPRVFLYSVIERIRCCATSSGNGSMVRAISRAVKQYKTKDVAGRKQVLEFLMEHFKLWSGGEDRTLRYAFREKKLTEDDHLFDAWLSAMTAWAHSRKQILSPTDAGLDPDIVGTEGHIAALSHRESPSPTVGQNTLIPPGSGKHAGIPGRRTRSASRR